MTEEHPKARISAARYATFTAWLAGSVIAALIGVFLLISLTLWAGRSDLPFEILLDHQRAKLAGDVGKIVFVGDSSLGNAVDARLFSKLSGMKATNLALTAAYGYQGTLRTIEAVLQHGAPLDIVIMQTAELMMRRPDPVQFDLTPSSSLGPLARFRRTWLDTMNLDQLGEALRFVLSGKERAADRRRGPVFQNDYIAQRDETAKPPQPGHFDAGKINAGNGAVLARIDGVCRKAKVNCIYIHGPLVSPVCNQISRYFTAVDRIIRASGLPLAAEGAECLAPSETGDQPDHTAPAAKAAMTKQIFERLKPFLAPRLASPPS